MRVACANVWLMCLCVCVSCVCLCYVTRQTYTRALEKLTTLVSSLQDAHVRSRQTNALRRTLQTLRDRCVARAAVRSHGGCGVAHACV